MSDSPQLEPDSFEHPLAAPDPTTEQEDRDAGPYLAHLARTLAAHGGGALSADLALDLVLNEIVEQARLASTATAAAIALVAGDDLICRATTGANAPGLGVRLSARSGLARACIESRSPQRCDDTQVDPRVDAEAYRNLEVRSILMVPILGGEQLLGVFQIFSPRANEFGDREVQTLQALSRRIVNNVKYAAESKEDASASADDSVPAEGRRKLDLEPDPPAIFAEVIPPKSRRTDYWTSALTGLVIALALLLGWMAGRDGRKNSATTSATDIKASPAILRSDSGSNSKPPQPTPPEERPKAGKPTVPSAGPEGISNAGLVVYERGKIIYQTKPTAKAIRAESHTPLTTLPPETVSSLLIHRVEPGYPDVARNASLEGEVSMQVIVDADGAVREVHVEAGNELLVPAAVEAVRQWRFTPYQSEGSNQEFQAHVIVRFKLP